MTEAINNEKVAVKEPETITAEVDGRANGPSPSGSSLPNVEKPRAPWEHRVVNLISGRSKNNDRAWRTTLIRLGPLSGIFSMLLACAALVASLGILAGSNGQRVENWGVPPSTYLAIFTAIANLSIRYAAYQGFIVAWWSKALKGSNLPKLHQTWSAGTRIKGALMAGPRMGLLGAACLFSTLVVIDGPLIQRASTVINVLNNQSISLNISMAPEIPHDFTGSWIKAAEENISSFRPSLMFNSTIPTVNGSTANNLYVGDGRLSIHYTSTSLAEEWVKDVVQGCPGTCKAKIRAPVLFPTLCQEHSLPTNASMRYDWRGVLANQFAQPLDANAFFISANLLLGSHEAVNVLTGFSTYDDECIGTLTYKICTFQSGIGEYEVLIQNDQILLNTLSTPTLLAVANNTAVNYNASSRNHPSTLAGIVNLIHLEWESYLAYTYFDGEINELSIGTNVPVLFSHGGVPDCPGFRDPSGYLLNQINKSMFYLGAVAAKKDQAYLEANLDPGLSSESITTGHLHEYQNVYHTDYLFFLGAAIVEVVCILFVAPTYWGWWRIGRPVSFSPLEIAKAFRSPLLEQYNSNLSGRELANAADDSAVRYGQMAAEKESMRSRLAFGDAVSVTRPTNGSSFDE